MAYSGKRPISEPGRTFWEMAKLNAREHAAEIRRAYPDLVIKGTTLEPGDEPPRPSIPDPLTSLD